MKKLLLLCLLLGVSIGAFAQVDTLSPITPPLRRSPFIRDMERITSSRAYRITYIGVPLVVAGLVVQERDHGFRHLRNDYVPSFRFRYDDYLQYAPAALMLGLKIVLVISGLMILQRCTSTISVSYTHLTLPTKRIV